MDKPKTFIEKMMVKEGGEVRYITALEDGKDCWFFLRVNADIYDKYKKNIEKGEMNIRDYGEIIESGWGEEAPKAVKQRMQEEYGVVC